MATSRKTSGISSRPAASPRGTTASIQKRSPEDAIARVSSSETWSHLSPAPKQKPSLSPERELQVEWRGISSLRPSPRNARTHSLRQIKQIQRSIEEFGFINPVLIDEHGQVLCGHGRVEAAKRLGMLNVPTIRIGDLNEAQKRAYIIADNQIATKAGWDKDLLAIELQGLIELDFDLELIGFEGGEIDLILDDNRSGCIHEDALPATGRQITQPDDVWQLGEHRLICADATQGTSYHRLLDGEKARLIFTDPPYNVPINGHVSGLGKTKHREFLKASGELSSEAFTAFLRSVFLQLVENSLDGTIHYVCMDWRHIGEMVSAGSDVFTELKNVCIWVKPNGGMGSFYRSRQEMVFVWKSGRKPHVNNFELGQFGRSRTNVWEYEGINSFRPGRAEELAMHPTCKPVAMIADAIKDCSKRDDIVLDPFGGSGSTLIACQKTGRRGRLMELDPQYCDVIIRRWRDFCGGIAIHCQSNLSFEELEARFTHQSADPPARKKET